MRIQKGFGGDENREPENPALVKAMQTLTRHDTPQTRRAFYEALLKSILLLPTSQEMEEVSSTLKRATSVSLIMGRTASGQEVLLAFTDPAAMRQWNPNQRYYMGLAADELFTIAAHNAIPLLVINPAGPVKGEITAAEMQLLAQGTLPDAPHTVETNVIPAATEVNLGAPLEQELPAPEIRQQFPAIFSAYPEIAAAYFVLMAIPPQPMALVVGIAFEPTPSQPRTDAVMRQVINQITVLLDQDQALHFAILGEALLHYVDETVAPFYVRTAHFS